METHRYSNTQTGRSGTMTAKSTTTNNNNRGVTTMTVMPITEALAEAINALNQIPNSPFKGCEGVPNTYKLIPILESTLAVQRARLEAVAKIHLWGEKIHDEQLKQEYIEACEYDHEDGFNPSADTESTLLRDAVEGVREVLGLPLDPDQ